jgi:glutaredoxin
MTAHHPKESDSLDIVLYHTSCSKCKVLKQRLDQKQIQYKEVNNTEEIINKGISSIPVLEVDNKFYTFSEAIKLLKEW